MIGDFGCLAGLAVLSVSYLVYLVLKVELSGVVKVHGTHYGLQSALIWVANLGVYVKCCLGCILLFDVPVHLLYMLIIKQAILGLLILSQIFLNVYTLATPVHYFSIWVSCTYYLLLTCIMTMQKYFVDEMGSMPSSLR